MAISKVGAKVSNSIFPSSFKKPSATSGVKANNQKPLFKSETFKVKIEVGLHPDGKTLVIQGDPLNLKSGGFELHLDPYTELTDSGYRVEDTNNIVYTGSLTIKTNR